jgi:hypothetical protein
MMAPARPVKITFAQMHEQGVSGLLVPCAGYTSTTRPRSAATRGPIMLSDIEDRFTCTVCGKRGADVRPDLSW